MSHVYRDTLSTVRAFFPGYGEVLEYVCNQLHSKEYSSVTDEGVKDMHVTYIDRFGSFILVLGSSGLISI